MRKQGKGKKNETDRIIHKDNQSEIMKDREKLKKKKKKRRRGREEKEKEKKSHKINVKSHDNLA